MLEPVRIVPQWKELKCQLKGKLEAQKGMPEATEGVMLSDRPSILFRESCCPSLMPVICFYSSGPDNYFASFTWRGTKGSKSKVRFWTYSVEGEAPVAQKDYSMEEDPKVLLITHIPNRNLLVAYCSDIHLRVFRDHLQDFQLISDQSSPCSITSLCYNPEMSELVTGAIGTLAFWSLGPEEEPLLSITQTISIASGEFVHFLYVAKERQVLVALCENVILVFDYQNRVKVRAFQVNPGVSLTCCSANWLQSCLYAGDLAGDVKAWSFDTGLQTTQFKAHLSAIVSVVSRDYVHTLMTASLDGLMKEWNLSTCELLRRVDIGEPVFQMQFISEQTFFLRTEYTFSIRTVNNFYQLFNKPNSILKKLVRIQCGPEKARILAVTEDGVIRFLSPVTGEILFVTWPFPLVEKALDYIYNPDQEELLVTMGTADIYALDTTKNPCPCKYILRTTDSLDDKVLCFTYSCLDLGGRTFSFIFSGYKSGRVRSITQHLYRMGSRRIHDGNVVALSSLSASGNLSYRSRESSYLCSYGSDEYIILSDVILKKNTFLEVEPLICIPSFRCRIDYLLLIPGYICVLTEHNRVRLWRQASLVPGRKNPFWKETGTMHSSSITSFDYCHALSMLVTGGSDGSVRLWDILGQMLVEFDTSLHFSRVCFANQRGDLVVGCNKNIYFISCVTYLPSGHLSKLAAQHIRDDVIERPLPFLPHFLLRFDIVFVPKFYQVGKHAKKYERLEPITNQKEVVMEKTVVKVVECAGVDFSSLPQADFYGIPPTMKEPVPGFAMRYQVLPQPALRKTPEKRLVSVTLQPHRGLLPLRESVPLVYRPPFWTGRSWPIAPDGYVPNSVIRAQLFPKGTPEALQCGLEVTRQPLPRRKYVKVQVEESQKLDFSPVEKMRKKKVQRKRRVGTMPEGHRRRDLLADIVSKPWLRHKPSDITVSSVIRAILELMDDVPFSTYLMCTAALVQIAESYTLPTEIQERAFERLIQDTDHKEVRMRVAAWEALGKMDLLDDKDVVPLAKALMDDNPRIRDLARSLLDSVAGITDKFVLKKEMQRLTKSSLVDLNKIEEPSQAVFPCRLRAAGIIAASKGDAVSALKEVSEKLMTRVDKRLTANLFLMADRPLEESPEQDTRSPPGRRKLGSVVPEAEEVAEAAVPEAHGEAKTRWLGLFDSAPQQTPSAKSPGAIAIESARRKHLQKAAKVPSVLKESASGVLLSRELISDSGSSAGGGSSSTSTSSSTWREVRRDKKRQKEKGLLPPPPGAKDARGPLQEGPKPSKAPRLVQPIALQRRDTRTQLYSEMLKHQQVKKEQTHLGPSPSPKQDSIARAGQAPGPSQPQEAVRGSLIDPNQEYSTDKSKWRTDLYKLLMLRIAPSAEGRTAVEDLLASARVALGGRAMSWDLFMNMGQSILTSQDKMTTEPAKMKRYMAELLKSSPWVLWPETAVESKETVVAVKMGREISRGPEAESESSSLEDMWRIKEEEEEEKEEVAKPVKAAAGKKPKEKKKRKATMSVAPGKRAAREEKKPGQEGEGEGTEGAEGEDEEISRKEGEAVRRKERELIKGKDQELVRDREMELGKEKQQVLDKEKEREVAKEKDRERAKQRKRESMERRERETEQKRAAMRRTQRRGTGAQEQAEALSREDEAEDSEEERRLASMAASKLAEAAGGLMPTAEGSGLLTELKERILAEAEEITLAELREKALAEAQERVLEELREQALAEARKNILAELREKALAEARERMLAEMRESSLAEARGRVLSEVMEQALAEAREMMLAAGPEGELDEERVRELAEERMRELMEERMRELTETLSTELGEASVAGLAEAGRREQAEAKSTVMKEELAKAKIAELAEEKVAEMVEAKVAEMVEAKVAELGEVKIMELAEAKAVELARAKAEELAEARVWEMVRSRVRILTKMRTVEPPRAKPPQELALEEAEAQWDDGSEELISKEEEDEVLEEEIEMWEDVGKDEVMIFSNEEREALMATLLEERAVRTELTCSDQAQLLLEILTKPEGLGGSDPKLFQRLFQVVSLLQIPSGLHYKDLAEYLLQSAEQIVRAGEEADKDSAREVSPIYTELRKAVEAHRPESADSRVFAARMRALMRAARLMMRARALKVQLERGFQQPTWWEKAEKAWMADEGRVTGRRDWVDQRLRDAIRKWQAEHRKVEFEKQEQTLKARQGRFPMQPVRLSESQGERRGERRREEEVLEGLEEPPCPPEPKKITWTLSQWQQRAREFILKFEKLAPRARQPYPPRLKMQRLPKGSLYMPTKVPLVCPSRVRGVRQHVLRPPGKAVDWEMFSTLYQSLMTLREEEGGVESEAWHQQLCVLLDLFGLSNHLVRALVQQLVVGDGRPHKVLSSKAFAMSPAETNLGERILYQVAHCIGSVPPKLPVLHGVIPLNYQNNVHPFRLGGVTRYGTLSFKWKTSFAKGRLPRLRLCIETFPEIQK
ncbi:WD repeat-containing protein 87 [Paroedura picta]|uniref:WD repeat-containing protein 87 n=1 Tax=Paroedura picta TaxID=143630 RepID=UPI004055EED6